MKQQNYLTDVIRLFLLVMLVVLLTASMSALNAFAEESTREAAAIKLDPTRGTMHYIVDEYVGFDLEDMFENGDKLTVNWKDGGETLYTFRKDYSPYIKQFEAADGSVITMDELKLECHDMKRKQTNYMQVEYKGVSCTVPVIVLDFIGDTDIRTSKPLVWNGKYRRPKITVKHGKEILTKGVDYIVEYSENKNIGYAFTNVIGIGYYYGDTENDESCPLYGFYIVPKGTSLKKATKKGSKLTVKWKKQKRKMSTKRVTGYQLQIATDKKFTKNAKKYKIEGYKKTSMTISKLDKNKHYYVRIRTYYRDKGMGLNMYSKWSKVKKAVNK